MTQRAEASLCFPSVTVKDAEADTAVIIIIIIMRMISKMPAVLLNDNNDK